MKNKKIVIITLISIIFLCLIGREVYLFSKVVSLKNAIQSLYRDEINKVEKREEQFEQLCIDRCRSSEISRCINMVHDETKKQEDKIYNTYMPVLQRPYWELRKELINKNVVINFQY